MTIAGEAPPTTYPGARRPDRTRRVDAHGVGLAVYEWGDPDAPPVFCVHGGLDFAATWDLLAPACSSTRAGGSSRWDQRGHGDSDRAALYSWDADLRDLLAVLDSTTSDRRRRWSATRRVAASSCSSPTRCPTGSATSSNLDGLPVPAAGARRAQPRPHAPAGDRAGGVARPPASGRRPSCASPARSTSWPARRGRLNPRLPDEWLLYIAGIGARHDADGWRWKLDPSMRFGGFGPWRPGVVDAADARRSACPSSASSASRSRRWAGAPGPRTCSPTCRPARPVRGAGRHRPLRPHRTARAGRPVSILELIGAPMSAHHRIVWLDHNAVRLALHPVRRPARRRAGRSAAPAPRPRRVGGRPPPGHRRPGPARCGPSTSPATAARPCRRAVATRPRC